MRIATSTLLATAFLACLPARAHADNTSFADAQNLLVGQPPVSFTLTVAAPVRFYTFNVVVGRSYCAEMVTTNQTSVVADSTIGLYRQSRTLAVDNDDAAEEPLSGLNAPSGHGFSRACWVAPASEAMYLRVAQSNAVTIQWQARLVETTLFSNWFFLGGDYGAFTLLRNSTSSPVNYTINWRSSAGTIVASTSGTLPSNGSAFINGGSFPAAKAAVNGTVEISHGSSPDAIIASTTVLSVTTGLSFDAPFLKREAW